jgi:hypothetical protein
MIRCAECNEENMDGLEYCDSCGAKLEVIATESAEAPAAPDSEAVEEAPAGVEASAASAASGASETSPEAVAEEPAAEAVGDIPTPAPEEAPGDVAPSEGPGSEGTEGTEGAAGSASLTITRGGTVGKVFELQAGDNLVGRWDPDSGSFPEVDMENDDAEARISRKHALIKFGDELTIEDIGSLNGTFVNRGQRLEPGSPATLKDGDEIIVGKTFFKVSRVP